MRSAFFFLILICLGCSIEPVAKQQTSNANVKVEFLFEHDGCRVYKFRDGVREVYFVKGGERTQWTETSGSRKHRTSVTHEVVTAEAPE